MHYDILLLGNYFFDQIFSGLPRFPSLGEEVWAQKLTTIGGAMFITASACTRLGVRCGWVSYFGNDYYSKFVYNLAQQEGIDLAFAQRLDRPYQRMTMSIPLGSERAFVTYEDESPAEMYDYWLECVEKADYRHVHLGGFPPPTVLPRLVERIHAKGATLSMDSQDGAHLQDPARCRDLIRGVDIFMPNAREARIITETVDVESALQTLMGLVKVAIIKDGAQGAWAGSDGEVLFSPAIRAGEVVDTTGAGDCFNAGFLMGYIVERAPLETCLRYGNICGGLSVTGVGGATAAPTRSELNSWLATL